jgi:hypothetical protein
MLSDLNISSVRNHKHIKRFCSTQFLLDTDLDIYDLTNLIKWRIKMKQRYKLPHHLESIALSFYLKKINEIYDSKNHKRVPV